MPGQAEDDVARQAVASLEAYAAYKMGDYDTARRAWLVLADQGNTTAMVNLSAMYDQGQGVPRDRAEALAWLGRAADLGDPRAQQELGLAYERGDGVPRDLDRAADYFRKAAEQGDEDGQFALGILLATRGDLDEAVHWLERAAVGGHPEARPILKTLR